MFIQDPSSQNHATYLDLAILIGDDGYNPLTSFESTGLAFDRDPLHLKISLNKTGKCSQFFWKTFVAVSG